MKLPEFAVNKRVTTAMMALILVVVGAISYTRLGLDFFPDLEYPTVSVITSYRGASPEDIENSITRPLEQVVSSVNRVKKLTSTSSEGTSLLSVEFEWGTSLDFAAQDLRDQIGLYKNYLPKGASDPLVVKFNMGQMPVVFWGITGNRPATEMKKLVDDEVARRLERVEGVAAAQTASMSTREILVDVDKRSLLALNLSLNQVLGALAMDNVNMPAGHLVERHSDYLVRTLGEFESLDDIRATVVGATAKGSPIYVRDVAEVRDTLKETRYVGRIAGQDAVFLFVTKRSGANTAIVGAAVQKALESLAKALPPDIKFHMIMDQADMIKGVTKSTMDNAWQGGLLAIAVIFFFLWNWRPTLIIGLSIPLSIITTFIALYFAGFTLNLLTLGGLALGIGMLVDNSIVVIENMFRHVQMGKDAKEAAKAGTAEVGMAITASTLTTIVVFLPLTFAQGITGKLVTGLALSIVFSLIASLFVALTIVPMLGSILFRQKKGDARSIRKTIGRDFSRPQAFYRQGLNWALAHRKTVIFGTLGLFLASAALIPVLGTEFMPSMDMDMLLFKVSAPVGTALQETDRIATLIEKVIAAQPEVKIISLQVGSSAEDNPSDQGFGGSPTGPHEAQFFIGLQPIEKRKAKTIEVQERIRRQLPVFENVKVEAMDMTGTFMGGATSPVEIKIFGKELPDLRRFADDVVARIKDVPGIRDATHTLAQAKPEYHIRINRDRAARFGLTVNQVETAVQTATLGQVATRYREAGEEIDIRVRFKSEFRDSIQAVASTPILTPMGTSVALDQVAEVAAGQGPIQIARENQARRVSITANISGRDLGGVVRDVKARIAPVEKGLPAGYFLEIGGSYQQMSEAFLILAGVFALALLLVYMVMASQFESLKHPFIIMFTIPMCLIGIVLGLLIAGRPVNLPVWIGIIILAGVAVNNAIVMIDYTNQLWRGGMDKKKAVVEGAVTRLRPVLMTALTTILGTFPMAISRSSGADMRNPLGITLLGGLIATTLLTLFVIPVMYSLFEKVRFRDKKIKATT
ncbi:MAG: efflux RND transporter permease subunit [Candidatus Aminicenantes bacterium]|nr:efflux RND transporter permease subunit [Candidatus Aminicenantes bacterium]